MQSDQLSVWERQMIVWRKVRSVTGADQSERTQIRRSQEDLVGVADRPATEVGVKGVREVRVGVDDRRKYRVISGVESEQVVRLGVDEDAW